MAQFCTPVNLNKPKYIMTPLGSPTTDLDWKDGTYDHAQESPQHYYHNEVLKVRESRNVEFKTAGGRYIYDILPQHVDKYGSAFLNGNGGTLYLGVLDDGTVNGIRLNYREEDHVTRTVYNTFGNFLPEVSPGMINVRFAPVYEQGRSRPVPKLKVVEISVKGGPVHELFETGNHKVFIKRDGSVEEQNPLQIRDLVISRYKMSLQKRQKPQQ
ncbi:PREDICTED: schlafen-like protein 1 [Branchiostoma belcheri]|uniref:Schlafen-like protein 1 n=1 Tax=Branchiostoma belcheri TaxID=7741 RepID=A0A6P4XPL1_BRABE|nr:PREDICTED: schlafen-like protein 1 [Branchiostoma belcheri]